MRITHQLPDRPAIISDYDIEAHSLTRVLDSTIHTILLKDKNTIADLDRLSKLDNESFSLMAYLQKVKK